MNKKKAKNALLFFILGNLWCGMIKWIVHVVKEEEDRDKKYSQLFDNWLMLKEKGCGVENYFHEKGFHEIAIYGYGNIGKHLVTQLSGTDIFVKYIIDVRKGVGEDKITQYHMTDKLPKVDVIVVTPLCEYRQIKGELQKKTMAEVVSMEDIIYEML